VTFSTFELLKSETVNSIVERGAGTPGEISIILG